MVLVAQNLVSLAGVGHAKGGNTQLTQDTHPLVAVSNTHSSTTRTVMDRLAQGETQVVLAALRRATTLRGVERRHQ
ncbi:hypothetical protein NDU88_005669 [Pleurodeles waltl]|uniref:Uncharacterized protein n=1 Tax=Pleurodeles waltl TaxID=8319 RepID=A0AAV7LNG9_PLEWA|nr:hypothetical protein NDU88_005669 [Pleurodeles waltl]